MDWLDTTTCTGDEYNDCEDMNETDDPNNCSKLYNSI